MDNPGEILWVEDDSNDVELILPALRDNQLGEEVFNRA